MTRRRVSLADMYDADLRATDPDVHRLTELVTIPHPLHGVVYGDGAEVCTHARRCTTPTGKAAVR